MKEKLADFYKIPWGGAIETNSDVLTYAKKEDLKGFNEIRFYTGERIGDWPSGITFYVRGEQEADYIVLGLHWAVVSEKVRQVFKQCEVKDVQFLPINVIHIESGKQFGPYWVLHVLKVADAVNWEKTTWVTSAAPRDIYPVFGIRKIVLNARELKDIEIFRVGKNAKAHTWVFISRKLKECLIDSGVKGFKFTPIDSD